MEKKTLEYQAPWGTENVQLEINTYMNNNGLYIGMLSKEEDEFEPYGDMTVNLSQKAPNYCAYLDTNNMSGIEKFVVDNDLGEFLFSTNCTKTIATLSVGPLQSVSLQ